MIRVDLTAPFGLKMDAPMNVPVLGQVYGAMILHMLTSGRPDLISDSFSLLSKLQYLVAMWVQLPTDGELC